MSDVHRLVAIVGRPNVGKSALFNRIAGARIAIVHAESGVTRDRLLREVEWGRRRFELVDTGGMCTMDGSAPKDVIAAAMNVQVETALADAAAAILVVDVEAGIVPMDEEVARILHRLPCATVVAANKADTAARDGAAAEFEHFGFPVFPISALHNRGVDALMRRVIPTLPDVENRSIKDPIKVAVVGRPNVGKSSYINRLLNTERVIVSDVAGTTRDSIDVPFMLGEGAEARHYLLIDTAGLRRRSKVDTAVETFGQMRAAESVGRADIVVLVIDATAGPTAQDKKIAAMVMERRKGCVMLVNKWDLMPGKIKEYTEAVGRAISFMGHCPLVFASSKSGYNVRRSIAAIDHVAAQVSASLPTGILNRTLLDAGERVQPPSVGGKRLRIFYVTQVGQRPLRFRFFVNNPRLLKPAYREFLVRTLRERFGLEGAPLVLEFVPRARKGD